VDRNKRAVAAGKKGEVSREHVGNERRLSDASDVRLQALPYLNMGETNNQTTHYNTCPYACWLQVCTVNL
jgi:hypothetical protein